MNWLRRLFGFPVNKRTRRPTGKQVAQAWKENVLRACEDNQHASVMLTREAQRPDSSPTLLCIRTREIG